jgi:hypothetical protein
MRIRNMIGWVGDLEDHYVRPPIAVGVPDDYRRVAK